LATSGLNSESRNRLDLAAHHAARRVDVLHRDLGGREHLLRLERHRARHRHHDPDLDRLLAERLPVDEREAGGRGGGAGSRDGLE
jgi:hypothetical protein